MGIYGESMTLVTEGRLINKLKKKINKFITNSKIKNDKIKSKALEVTNPKFTSDSVIQFVKEYKLEQNMEKLFKPLNENSFKTYENVLKEVFGTTSFYEIKDLYNKKKFDTNLTVKDSEVFDFYNFIYDYKDYCNNIEATYFNSQEYEEFNEDDHESIVDFREAWELQYDLFEYLYGTLFTKFIYRYETEYMKNLKRVKVDK